MQPGFPDNLTLRNVAGFVRGAFSSEYHPLGTCAMGRGGVVDERLRVKGTVGLRVVDASVAPLMVSPFFLLLLFPGSGILFWVMSLLGESGGAGGGRVEGKDVLG